MVAPLSSFVQKYVGWDPLPKTFSLKSFVQNMGSGIRCLKRFPKNVFGNVPVSNFLGAHQKDWKTYAFLRFET